MHLEEQEIRGFLRDRGMSPEVLNLLYHLETLVNAGITVEFHDGPALPARVRQGRTLFTIAIQKKPMGSLIIERKVTGRLQRAHVRAVLRNLERILEKNCILAKYERLMQEASKERQFLFQIIPYLGRIADEREICAVMLRRLLRLMPVDRASIMLLTERRTLRMMASKGIPGPYASDFEATLKGSLAGLVVETGKPIRINKPTELTAEIEARMICRRADAGGADGGTGKLLTIPSLLVPIQVGTKILGVLNLSGSRARKAFTDDDYRFLQAIMTPMGMAIENSRFLARATETRKVKHELELAAEIQRSLLPTGPLVNGSFRVTGLCRPAEEIGGDYFDYFDRDGAVHVMIGDVTGHGIPSALLMTMFRSAFLSHVQKGLDPAAMLHEINRTVQRDMAARDSFVTCIYLQAESKSGVVRFANAGHPAPLHYRAAHRIAQELPGSGTPTGVLEEASYQTTEVRMDPGDRLILFTDGVTEAGGADGTGGYDVHALMRTVCERLPVTDDDGVADDVLNAALRCSPGELPDDDMTIAILARKN